MSRNVGKSTMLILTRSDTNQAVQPLEMARGLKFHIKEVKILYFPSSENKGADQLRSLRLCFRICKTLVFSWCGSSVDLARPDVSIWNYLHVWLLFFNEPLRYKTTRDYKFPPVSVPGGELSLVNYSVYIYTFKHHAWLTPDHVHADGNARKENTDWKKNL